MHLPEKTASSGTHAPGKTRVRQETKTERTPCAENVLEEVTVTHTSKARVRPLFFAFPVYICFICMFWRSVHGQTFLFLNVYHCCEHARFCAEVLCALYTNFHSFIHTTKARYAITQKTLEVHETIHAHIINVIM